jgi:hypothetical protein
MSQENMEVVRSIYAGSGAWRFQLGRMGTSGDRAKGADILHMRGGKVMKFVL